MDTETESKREIAELRAIAHRLVVALDAIHDFGEHDPACSFWVTKRCTCGFHEAEIKALEAAKYAAMKGIVK